MLERPRFEPSLEEKYNVAGIMKREKDAWKIKDIPNPPDELFHALERANEQGWTTLEPHYFPTMDLAHRIKWIRPLVFNERIEVKPKWPGLGIRPEDRYWQYIKEGILPKNSAQLYNMWVLIDQIDQIYFDENFEFKQDGLRPILHQLRKEYKIHTPYSSYAVNSKLLFNTRCGTRWNEFHDFVKPAIAAMIEVKETMVRLPRVIERNMLSNIFPEEFPQQIIWEWAEDKRLSTTDKKNIYIESKMGRIITSGKYPVGSKNSIGNVYNQRSDDDEHSALSYNETDIFSFRPMITFPTQK